MNISKKLALLPLTLSTLLITGCEKAPPPVEAKSPAATPVAASKDPLEIELKPDLKLDLKVGEPKMLGVAAKLSVAGRVEADETRMIRVSSPVSGRIVELNVVEGQTVEKGQVIATIRSTELTAAQTSLLKATTDKLQADRAVTRARQLLDAGVIGSAELQRRETEATQVNTELVSLRRQLSVIGMTDEAIAKLESTRTIDSQTHVVATASGVVLDRHVTPGQVVQAAEPLCVIADLSSVWLVADVPEEHARALRIGKRVDAEVPALPEDKLSGAISYIGATVHPETRTITARMDLKNPKGRYKPQMLATMLLMDQAEARLVVPASAVIRDGANESVFVQIAPNKFRLQAVTLGEEIEQGMVVLSGLEPGEKIVLDGAFHLNNERIRLATGGASE